MTCNYIRFWSSLLPSLVISLFSVASSARDTSSYLQFFGIPNDLLTKPSARPRQSSLLTRRRRHSIEGKEQDIFASMEAQVEEWANRLMKEAESDGWVEVDCLKALRKKYNPHSETKQWVKWMKDSRSPELQQPHSYTAQNHPCMKLVGTIHAPFEIVCRYLSQEERLTEYNSLLVKQQDVQEVTPNSKLCWSQTKKLLFIQPRDFVTFCTHKWIVGSQENGSDDTTQLVLNQAWENVDDTQTRDMTRDHLRAFALRGATWISRHPLDPDNHTKIVMLQHCNCGNDIPEWGVRTAVKVLAPIKPFEIIHRINTGVQRARPVLEEQEAKAQNSMDAMEFSNRKKGRTKKGGSSGRKLQRSTRPAGIAQMGYAAFWPKGGGLMEESRTN